MKRDGKGESFQEHTKPSWQIF